MEEWLRLIRATAVLGDKEREQKESAVRGPHAFERRCRGARGHCDAGRELGLQS